MDVKRRMAVMLAGVAGGVCLSWGISPPAMAAEGLPELLRGQTFIYDELETGEGSALYTLVFTEEGYRLYNDNGAGVISEGTAFLSGEKELVFQEGEEIFYGSYRGSAFEKPSVTLEYGGRTLEFEPDTDSGEYVYLSYLGVFEGEIRGEAALLILDRWYEFYLYTGEELVRGTYEIYEDGRVEFTTLDQEELAGRVEKEEDFDVREIRFCLDLSQEEAVFTYAGDPVTYEAEHAMGTYTLALYDPDVFVIRGVDGYVKAMGTIDLGEVSYFPRSITDEAELDEKFTVSFTCQEEELIFPASTYLLPRSGNIDEETGRGSYWMAGTTLEFIRTGEGEAETISYEPRDVTGLEAPIRAVFEDGKEELSQVMPSLGTAKPLVLLIDFPDYKRPRFISAQGMEEALFDLENRDSLGAWYYQSSYGSLTIDGTVLDWYRMEKDRGDYQSDREIMEEVLNYYIHEEGLDLSEYDGDGDGAVDSLYVLWAGNLDMDTFTWSCAYRSTWKDSPEEWGTAVTGYIFVPGTTVWSSVPPLVCNLNSLTHETGHLLGLNDYYSYDTTGRREAGEAYTGGALEGGLGGMDMMDANIADHNAFSKWLLGWLEPQVVEYEEIASLASEERTYTLRPSNEEGDAIFVKLQESDSLFTELLVIEVVSPAGNAGELTRLKHPVVRILHADASLDEEGLEGNWNAYGFKYDNSYTTTKFISVLEADGKDEVLNYLPAVSGGRISYDPEDYYGEGDQITPYTYPSTDGYDAYGNAAVCNDLTITVESLSESGEAVIRLGYEDRREGLSITAVSPEPRIVPWTEETQGKMPADTSRITVTFDQEIEAAEDDSLSRILAVSGNQLLENYHLEIEGADLSLVFEEELEPNRDYTVVIPAGTVKGKESGETNGFNSIFGFVTEE